jgi:hypothetical protein
LGEVERSRRAKRDPEQTFHPSINVFGADRAHDRGGNPTDDAGAVQTIAPTPRAVRCRDRGVQA